jgi:hypothetical protein
MRDVEPRTFHGAAMAVFPVVLIGQQTSLQRRQRLSEFPVVRTDLANTTSSVSAQSIS